MSDATPICNRISSSILRSRVISPKDRFFKGKWTLKKWILVPIKFQHCSWGPNNSNLYSIFCSSFSCSWVIRRQTDARPHLHTWIHTHSYIHTRTHTQTHYAYTTKSYSYLRGRKFELFNAKLSETSKYFMSLSFCCHFVKKNVLAVRLRRLLGHHSYALGQFSHKSMK